MDLAIVSIVVSDNIAINQIIDLVGGPLKVTEFCRKLGLFNTKLQRKMLDIEAMNSGKDNFTTAEDMGYLLKQLVNHKVVSKEASETIMKIMMDQQYRNKLPALIPAVESYDYENNHLKVLPGTVIVANKTGDLWKVQNDVGIFFMPDNNVYIIVMFTSELSEDSEGIRAISEISKVIYEEMANKYK